MPLLLSDSQRRNESSPVSPLSFLPLECRSHVLSYLSIDAVLRYGQCNKRCIDEILSEMQQRRNQSFLGVFVYLNELSGVGDDHYSVYCLDKTHLESSRETKDRWQELPRVRERIQALYRIFPSLHPSHNDLRDLVLDLQQDSTLRFVEAKTLPDSLSWLQKLRSVTRAYRLHARLLSGAIRNYPGFHDSTSPRSIPLERYIGDVLIAYYLMPHSLSGIVQGGPTMLDWINDLRAAPSLENLSAREDQVTSAGICYRIWVYFHSTILRVFPFTPEQCRELCLDAHGCRRDGCLCVFLKPHLPFVGCSTGFLETLSPHLSLGLRSSLQVSLSSFGPLGPAFRGRDNLRTSVMPLQKVMELLYSNLPSIDTSSCTSTWVTEYYFFEWLLEEHEILRWMMELHREFRSTRPMTVSPPTITFEFH